MDTIKSGSVIILLTIILSLSSFAQKPYIDTSVFKTWPEIAQSSLSPDGKFLYYNVQTHYNVGKVITYVKPVKTSTSGFHFISEKTPALRFSLNSKYLFVLLNDSLTIYTFPSYKKEIIGAINYYSVSMAPGEQWLVYSKKGSGALTVRGLDHGKIHEIKGATEYMNSPDGEQWVVQLKNSEGEQLISYAPKTGKIKQICSGHLSGNIFWDNRQAIITAVQNNKKRIIQFDFENGTGNEVKFPFTINGDSLRVDQVSEWSKKSGFVLLRYVNSYSYPEKEKEPATIWRTSDRSFLPENKMESYIYAFNINTGSLSKVQKNDEQLSMLSDGSRALVIHKEPRSLQEIINLHYQPVEKASIVQFINGTDKSLQLSSGSISPSGKFILGTAPTGFNTVLYDLQKDQYYDLNILINKQILADKSGDTIKYLGQPCWLFNDTGLIISDGVDLWRVCINKQIKVSCLTRYFGRKRGVVFSVSFDQLWDDIIRPTNGQILLKTVHNDNLDQGFFQTSLSGATDPTLLFRGPFVFRESMMHFSRNGDRWTGSGNKLYLKTRISGNSIELFVTKDHRTFLQVGGIHPENKYNWYTSELKDVTATGKARYVMYKPENFSPLRKYPVIIYYYEIMSHDLNEYHVPEPAGGAINIPWFVSREYIVCTPDIINNQGTPGLTALNTVSSVLNDLKKMPFIDSTKVGIAGHSFGGLETNYILTHSKSFAAAYSGAGIADLVSFGGTIEFGVPRAEMIETGQFQVGTSQWQSPELYRSESAISNVDKVTTPVLMMHNAKDSRIPYEQSLAFFLGLRRFGKSAWLINYENESHTINEYPNQIDFTLKLTGFFDYFLKGMPMPDWMRSN
jgi:dienelactone hydrolase